MAHRACSDAVLSSLVDWSLCLITLFPPYVLDQIYEIGGLGMLVAPGQMPDDDLEFKALFNELGFPCEWPDDVDRYCFVACFHQIAKRLSHLQRIKVFNSSLAVHLRGQERKDKSP